ncbi:MAG: hypothetical protein ABEJ62_00050 [Candidatus Nanohaloarchaea archaeon]
MNWKESGPMDRIRRWLGGSEEENGFPSRLEMEVNSIADGVEENLERLYDGARVEPYDRETSYQDSPEIMFYDNGHREPFCAVGLTAEDGPLRLEYLHTDEESYEIGRPPFDEAVAAVEYSLVNDPKIAVGTLDEVRDVRRPKQG